MRTYRALSADKVDLSILERERERDREGGIIGHFSNTNCSKAAVQFSAVSALILQRDHRKTCKSGF